MLEKVSPGQLIWLSCRKDLMFTFSWMSPSPQSSIRSTRPVHMFCRDWHGTWMCRWEFDSWICLVNIWTAMVPSMSMEFSNTCCIVFFVGGIWWGKHVQEKRTAYDGRDVVHRRERELRDPKIWAQLHVCGLKSANAARRACDTTHSPRVTQKRS